MLKKDNLEDIISQVANKSLDKEKKITERIQLVVFSLDNEEYAVDIKELKEVIKIPVITPLPNSPEFIKGILNLRGRIVVVVDLEKRFNLIRENKTTSKHIIVIESEGTDFGVVVDHVKEVLWVDKDLIHNPSELASAKIKTDYIKGVVVVGEKEKSRLLVLLDIKKMLDDKDLISLDGTIKKVVK